MEWGMLMVLVGIAALLQLAFFWYYLRLGQSGDSTIPGPTSNSSDHGSGANSNPGVDKQGTNEADGGDDGVVTCPNCGHENEWEPTYEYCSNCVTKLG